MRVGVDVRPALLSVAGVARAARCAYLALRACPELQVVGFGASWQRARPGHDLPGVVAPRLPGRLQAWAAPLGFGVESLLGELDVFQHTDLVFPPVRRAAEVLLVHDLLFLSGRGWHDPGFAERVGPRLFRKAATAAAVVVPSARVADDARARGLCAPERLVVAPLGVDHMDPTPLADDEVRVAAVCAAAGLPRRPGAERLLLVPGTREPRKNQLALLEAFLAVADPAARLLLVGPRGWGVPGLEALLENRAARADGRGELRVAATGALSEEDFAALLRVADAVAYPSLGEGFGLPALEALAMGRPLLTSIESPMADLGGDGLLAVDPTDPAALRAGLARLLRDDDLRARLSRLGPARVAALNWAAHARTLVSVYAGINL